MKRDHLRVGFGVMGGWMNYGASDPRKDGAAIPEPIV
jgi:hypothetical protein